MNKKILITQRSDLVPQRVVSHHVPRLPMTCQNEISKPSEPWYTHQSGAFSSRNRVQTQNKHEHHQRMISISSASDRPTKQLQPDLSAIAQQVSKLSLYTQQRLSDINTRLCRMEQSVQQLKTTHSQSLSQQLQKSLDDLFRMLNQDIRKSEESIVKHVSDIREEVRRVTQNKLQELKRGNQVEIRGKVDEIRKQIGGGVEKVRQELKAVVTKVKQEIGRVGLEDWIISTNRVSKTNMVKFNCSAKTQNILVPIPMNQYCYYITPEGFLTDENGYVLTNESNQPITLQPQHLSKLLQWGLLS